MDNNKTQTLSRKPTRKHLQSTFPPMIVDYMSRDDLSKHLDRQMSIHAEKYKEPEQDEELDEVKEKKEIKRKASKLKKLPPRHGMILHGSNEKLQQSMAVVQDEEEEELDMEEQAHIRKMKEKEHDELLQGLLLLRDYYKAEYKKALQDKVEQQRRSQQLRHLRREEEMKAAEHQQELMQHKVVRKLPRSIVINDVQFNKDLQTDFYKMISLENQMKKEGFLNKSHEIKEFWEFITVPENLKDVLEDGQLLWERIRNFHKGHNKKALLTQDKEISSSQQAKQTSMKKFKGGTAISTWRSTTHGIRTILTPSTACSGVASGSRKSSAHVSRGKQNAKKTPTPTMIPIEQKFPKVEFPPLAAYRLEFGEPEPDPEEVRKQEEVNKRLQERNCLKRTLNTMFSHALANRAATQRLMNKNEDYNFENLSGASNMDEFHDLASVQLKPRTGAIKKRSPRTSSGKGEKCKSGSTKSADRKAKSLENVISDGSESRAGSLSPKEDLVVELPPLTLDQLSTRCIVREAKCLSSFWVNPMAKQRELEQR